MSNSKNTGLCCLSQLGEPEAKILFNRLNVKCANKKQYLGHIIGNDSCAAGDDDKCSCSAVNYMHNHIRLHANVTCAQMILKYEGFLG